MELHITQQTLPVNEVAFDSFAEQPLECDVLLPDYCPDIQRILNCDVCCSVRENKVMGQRLTVDGEMKIRILYVGDRGQIRSLEHKMPFLRNVDLRTAPSEPMTEVHCKVDYVNCRAVSSRRLEVRGAATLRIRVVSCGESSFLGDCTGMGIQLKKKCMDLCACRFRAESPFSFQEEVELGSHPPMAQIILGAVAANVTDFKVISGKIVTKGELKLRMIYEPVSQEENPSPERLEYTLPISQIIDAPGADEDCVCGVTYTVTGWDLQPKPDLDGEARVLGVDVQLVASASVHRRQSVSVAEDCYCTQYQCDFESQAFTVLNLLSMVNETHHSKETINPAQPLQSVLYAWSRIRDQQTEPAEEGLRVAATVQMFALVLDQEGKTQLYEQTSQFTHMVSVPDGCKTPVFFPRIVPTSTEGTVSGGRVEVQAVISITGCLYCLEKLRAITSVTADENSPKARPNDCALTIYYGDAGESLWDIAKKYNTSIAGVVEENGLDQDILPQRTMLLIPMM